MKIILSLVIGTFLLTNCNNRQPEVKNDVLILNQDNRPKDTVLERTHKIAYNPFKDINNFEVNFGDRFIDSLHASYTSQEQVKATFTRDICIGDNCESIRLWQIHKRIRYFIYLKAMGVNMDFQMINICYTKTA